MTEFVHTSCKHCDADIEGPHTDSHLGNKVWIDRGGNKMCHHGENDGYLHVPHEDWTERAFVSSDPGEIPIPDDVRVVVRNKFLVEVIKNGNVTAKAVRGSVESGWHIGALNSLGVFEVLAEVLPNTQEVLGRKMVLALLRELI